MKQELILKAVLSVSILLYLFAMLTAFLILSSDIVKEVSAKTIKTTVTVPKTVNMKTTVPQNDCNCCLADTETREGRLYCYENFCK